MFLGNCGYQTDRKIYAKPKSHSACEPRLNRDKIINSLRSRPNCRSLRENKYLGMLIDKKLNFRQHVDKLLVNISKRIGVLGRIRNNLTVDAANKVYQSLVLPVMDYCDVAWSSIGKIERDKLDRAQRRAAKIVLKTKDSDAEKNLKWLPLSMRRDMHTINLTFKCLKGSPPMFFKDYFKVFRTIHNTRGSGHNLLLPKVRTETARKSFYFNGSKLFNNIPSEMKDFKSVVIFKTRILEFYRSKSC